MVDYRSELIKLLEEYSKITNSDKIWEYMYRFSYEKLKGSSEKFRTATNSKFCA